MKKNLNNQQEKIEELTLYILQLEERWKMRLFWGLMVLFIASACKKECENYDSPTLIKAPEVRRKWTMYASPTDSINVKLESKSEQIERLPSLTTEKMCGLIWRFSIDNQTYDIYVVKKNGIESIQHESGIPLETNIQDTIINGVTDKIFVGHNIKWSNTLGLVEINYSGKNYHL